MKKVIAVLGCVSLSLFFTNCKSDDNGSSDKVIELRDRQEVYTENIKQIEEYLNNNYLIEKNGVITFDSITSPNYKGQPVIAKDARLQKKTFSNDLRVVTPITMRSFDPATGMPTNVVTRLEYSKVEDPVKYDIYYMIINEGKGKVTSPIDSLLVKSKVSNFKNEEVVNPLNGSFYSFPITLQEYRGDVSKPLELSSAERQLMQFIKTASGLSENISGELVYDEGSAGRVVAFVPSGLFGFNNGMGSKLKGYQPAIVDFTLINALERDHDLDGIPSKYEVDPAKVKSGQVLTLEDYFGYSTSGHEKTPNFLNIDDDDDGVPTRIELEYTTEDGVIKHYKYDDPALLKCSNIPNYLDKTCRPYLVEGVWTWPGAKPN